MNGQIIGLAPGLAPSLDPWLEQGLGGGVGAKVKGWAQTRFDHAVQDIFGYHALQLGAPTLQSLAQSRIAHRWLAVDTGSSHQAALFANASALPFFESTLDLVTLPFTLDMHSDPDAVLDEVARVLVPEGRVVMAGFRAMSYWGVSHFLGSKRLPEGAKIYSLRRLKTSLSELGLMLESLECGQWPSFHGVYFAVARKRVLNVRPIRRAAWKLPKLDSLPLNPFPTPNPRGLGKQ
ncbi:MAG: methyltransferase domain-containing protein [Cytophagales bacterium]|nr:methyltransferase domain-containing protein [Cytophagales bacterium]